MRAIIEEGEANVAERMQELALAEGALLKHLLIALFTSDEDKRLLAHRQLSRHLVGLWVTNNNMAMNLLERILVSRIFQFIEPGENNSRYFHFFQPSGLLRFLESDEQIPSAHENEHLITRDNLKLAQDHAARVQRNPHLVAFERKLRSFEKEVEVPRFYSSVTIAYDRKFVFVVRF